MAACFSSLPVHLRTHTCVFNRRGFPVAIRCDANFFALKHPHRWVCRCFSQQFVCDRLVCKGWKVLHGGFLKNSFRIPGLIVNGILLLLLIVMLIQTKLSTGMSSPRMLVVFVRDGVWVYAVIFGNPPLVQFRVIL